MSHFPYRDRFWRDALNAVREHAEQSDRVLAPQTFCPELPNALPYSVVRGMPINRFDVVIVHKGEVSAFPADYLSVLLDTWVPIWANEVFVVLRRNSGKSSYVPDIHYHSFVRAAIPLVLHPPQPLLPRNTKLLFESGSFGDVSEGGVYNGSIVRRSPGFAGLLRAERFFESQCRIRTSSTPMFVEFDENLAVSSFQPLDHLEAYGPFRVEDFRLLHAPTGDLLAGHPLVTDYDRTHQVISKIDIDGARLEPWLRPQLDIEVRRHEKNWVYFFEAEELFLVYSLSPFIVLKQHSFNSFTTYNRCNIEYPWKKRGFMSCSTNPVALDETHYLMLFHDRDRNGLYRQGGLLLRRGDFRPEYCTTREFFAGEGGLGLRPGIIYTMSCEPCEGRFLLTNGEGDSCTTVNWLSAEEITDTMVHVA